MDYRFSEFSFSRIQIFGWPGLNTEISESKLIVASLVSQEEQEPLASSAAIDGETSTAEGSEEAVEDNGDDDDGEDEGTTTTNESPEEPAPSDGDLATDESEFTEDDE
jgi:hypothetical protein